MKKVLWLGIALSFILASHSFAAYTLTATATGTSVNATLSGVPLANNKDTYQLLVQKNPFPSGAYTSTPSQTVAQDPTKQTPSFSGGASQGTVTWSIGSNPANTTLYVRAIDIPYSPLTKASYATDPITVTTQTASIPLIPLTTQLQSNGSILVSGQIDLSKTNQAPSSFSAQLIYSTSSAVDATGKLSTVTGGPLSTTASIDNSTGKYSWIINGSLLQPSTIYYIQQIVTDGGGNVQYDTVDNFNSSVGNLIIPGTASAAADQAKRSYTFLSDPSNQTILPDPDLCAQEQAAATAAGKAPPNCDINYYINLALQFLIGLSGVVLVVRLMYEGFVIMTTDIPFIKAKSKKGFQTALVGLLLALSSYVILKTINPQLVNETVGITQLQIIVDAPDTDITPLTQNSATPSNGTPEGICTSGVVKVTVQKSSFIACSNYNNIPVASNLQNMLTAAYAAGYTITGGGFRTSAVQTQLRIAHCNGNTTDPNATCNPPTAPVGRSNHESGLAFDLQCNGGSAYNFGTSACFQWMQQNAGTYGLKNFAKEPWHWSWDGR